MSPIRCLSVCFAGFVLSCAGCETSKVQALLPHDFRHRTSEAEIEKHRERFIVDRNPESFRWLLTHGIENGMTVMDVNRVFGDTSERIDNDVELKRERGEYLQTDVAYKWGPDRDGQSVILFFREGRLVNVRADQFTSFGSAAASRP
jgi:hypothetical protein